MRKRGEREKRYKLVAEAVTRVDRKKEKDAKEGCERENFPLVRLVCCEKKVEGRELLLLSIQNLFQFQFSRMIAAHSLGSGGGLSLVVVE